MAGAAPVGVGADMAMATIVVGVAHHAPALVGVADAKETATFFI